MQEPPTAAPEYPVGCAINDKWLKTPTGTYSLSDIQGVSVRTRSKPPMALKIIAAFVGLSLFQLTVSNSKSLWVTAFQAVCVLYVGLYWLTHKHNEVILRTTTGEIIVADFSGSDLVLVGGGDKESKSAFNLCNAIEKHLQNSTAA